MYTPQTAYDEDTDTRACPSVNICMVYQKSWGCIKSPGGAASGNNRPRMRKKWSIALAGSWQSLGDKAGRKCLSRATTYM